MDSIHQILDEIEDSTERSVLATVIKVEGSAYRKEGASMLSFEGGRQVGIISAGCLEIDLAIRADKLLNEDAIRSCLVIYDMSSEDDLSWGRGAGCNGKIHILLEQVDPEFRKQLCTLKNHLDLGNPVVSVRILREDFSVARTVFLTKDQHKSAHQDSVATHLGRMIRHEGKPRVQYMEDLKANVYIHPLSPKPCLYIFGAGPDARPLAAMAQQTGFSIKVWDWRLSYCNQAHFPGASFMQAGTVADIMKNIHFNPGDSVIMMTHDFQRDKELLHSLLAYRQISYLGILGPRKRTARLLEGADIPERLHSPVGLDIGADGPEEISISILADLIRTARQFSHEKGGFFDQARDHRYLSGGGAKQKIR